MTRFFATADANGMISHELAATDSIAARRELEAAVGSGESREWIDDAETDLEDALDVSFDGMSYSDAYDYAHNAGAVCKLADKVNDSWDIFAIEDCEQQR